MYKKLKCLKLPINKLIIKRNNSTDLNNDKFTKLGGLSVTQSKSGTDLI